MSFLPCGVFSSSGSPLTRAQAPLNPESKELRYFSRQDAILKKLRGGGDVHLAVGPNDRPNDASALPNRHSIQNDTLRNPRSSLDNGVWSDRNVGSHLSGRVNRRSRVNVNGPYDLSLARVGLSEKFRRVLGKVFKVGGRSGQGRTGRLDLAPEVGRLVDVELALGG